MKFLFLLILSAMLGVFCSLAIGAESDGVNTEERVVNLPQDQDTWYISVVGAGESYATLINWFVEDEDLENIKSQVKFRAVEANSDMFRTRYASNVSGLPTVRMQKPDGTVIYEASGDEIPYTSQALYGALADSANGTQGVLRPWRGLPDKPWLPWRRKMEKQCKPAPAPCPNPEPVDVDVEPVIVDDTPDGPPDFVSESNVGLTIFLTILGGIAGGVIAVVQSMKKEWDSK